MCTRKHEKTRENNRGLVIFFLVLRSLTNTTACRAKLSKRRTNKCKRHSRQARGQNEQTLAVGSGWGGVNEGHRTQQRKRRATATPRAPCNTLAQRLEQRAVAANPTADYSASGEGVHLTTGAVFQTENAPPPRFVSSEKAFRNVAFLPKQLMEKRKRGSRDGKKLKFLLIAFVS